MESVENRWFQLGRIRQFRLAGFGVLLGAIVLLATGCSAGGAPTPVAVNEPVAEATESVVPTPVAEPTALPEPTAVPEPTPTLVPTAVPEPTLAPTAVPAPETHSDEVLLPTSGDDSALVQVAIDRASDGATVMLGAGTFRIDERLVVNGDIEIVGLGRDTTVLERATDGAVLVVDDANLRLSGLTVTSTFETDADEREPMLEVVRSTLTMDDVRIDRAPGTGLWMSATNATLTDSVFSDNGWIGLWSVGNSELTIVRTDATGNEDAFVFDEFTVADISDSSATNNSGAAYWWDGSASGIARDNEAIDNAFGFLASGKSSPTMTGNFAEGNSEVGFGFRDSATAIANENEAVGNTQGFYVDGEASPTLADNTAIKNSDSGFAWFDQATGTLIGAVANGNGNDLYIEDSASPEIVENGETSAPAADPTPTATASNNGARCPSGFTSVGDRCVRVVGTPQLRCSEGQLVGDVCAIDLPAVPQESCDAPYLLYRAEAGDPTLPGLQGTCAWFDSGGSCPAGDVYNIDAGGGERFTHPCKHASQVTYQCDSGAPVGDVCRSTVTPVVTCVSGSLTNDGCVEYADPL